MRPHRWPRAWPPVRGRLAGVSRGSHGRGRLPGPSAPQGPVGEVQVYSGARSVVTAESILEACAKAGITLRTDGVKLTANPAPPSDLDANLRMHKAAIITLLGARH